MRYNDPMFGIYLGRKRELIVAVADVSGGSVGLAIIVPTKRGPARVLAAERAPLTYSDPAGVASIGSQIRTVGEKLNKSYSAHSPKGGVPTELFVILHSQIARSKVSRVESKYSKETTITDRHISDMAAKILESERDIDTSSLFEASVIRTELNGYPTSIPTKKRVTRLAVSTLLSEVTHEVRRDIEIAFQQTFPHLVPVFRSATRASVSVLAEIMGESQDYVVIDIGGGGSTITVIREGIAVESQSVNEGTRQIVSRIAGTGMPEEALSMMRMLAREQCSDPACDAIRVSMVSAEPELVKMFGEAISKCVSNRRLPNTLLLIAHPDLATWLSRFFTRIDFAQFTLTTQPFEVRNILAKDFSKIIAPGDVVGLDPSLALSCALVNIEKASA